jgi:DNA invertase Pin-like site-specific DNA recombinase
MEHRVHFIVAELGKVHDNFTLHIWASIAEQERKMLAERVKAAPGSSKGPGRKAWPGSSLQGGTTPM